MKTRLTVATVLAMATLFGIGAEALAIGPGGAKGRLLHYRSLKNWWSYYTPRTPPPGILRCHVEKLFDGSAFGGAGAAQVLIAGNWVDVEVCDDIQGLPVRVNSYSDMWVRDPYSGTSDLSTLGDVDGSCDCELEPGGKVWVTGEKDTGMPPEEVKSPAVATRSEVDFDGYLEYVVDYEEDTEVTRVINSPYSQGIIWSTALIGPEPTPTPLAPGESLRYLPTGEIAGTGTIMVKAGESVTAAPGETVLLEFEVWNICEVEATYGIEVEDGGGWGPVLYDPLLTVLPGEMEVATVEVTVPATPEVEANAVILRAMDLADPMQFHVDALHVVPDAASAVSDEPETAFLGAPHPNPFRQSTSISFRLACSARVELAVVDSEGRRVRSLRRELHDSSEWCEGVHTVRWDGRDEQGHEAPAGVYFVQMAGSGFRGQVRPLVLIR